MAKSSLPKNLSIDNSGTSRRGGHRKNIQGLTFGRWTVLELAGSDPNTGLLWLCQCECGTVKVTRGSNLRNGTSHSCGCLQKERASASSTVHGETRKGIPSAEMVSFDEAKRRCTNPRSIRYDLYGGRGIQFRFTSINEFLDAVGRKPSPDHSLDRINNDGHYEPGNVRWATRIEQANNRSTNHFLTYKGESHTVAEWSRLLGVRPHTLFNRIRKGLDDHAVIDGFAEYRIGRAK